MVTEWKAYRTPDFKRMRRLLRRLLVFDRRNLYEPALMQALGLEHIGSSPGATAVEMHMALVA